MDKQEQDAGLESSKINKDPKAGKSDDTKVNLSGVNYLKQNEKDRIITIRTSIKECLKQNAHITDLVLSICVHLVVLAFGIAAIKHWYNNGRKSLVLTDGLGLYLLITLIFYWSLFYYKILKPVLISYTDRTTEKKSKICCFGIARWSKPAFYIVPPILFAAFLAYDTAHERSRLTGLLGVAIIYFLGFLFSKYPSKVRWSIVYRATFIQITLALCLVKWGAGRVFFENVGNKLQKFLSYSDVGAAFVYSDNLVYNQAVFAFKCLSPIFFVNFIVEVLFYYQILQRVFSTMADSLQKIVGTTSIETINACISCLLGMSEAILVIKLYLKDLTISELHAVLLTQLSTVAGSEFAAYAAFGIQPGYLVTASLMSAPAALGLSKLLYPETEVSKTNAESLVIDKSHKEKFNSALSAGCEGALSAVPMVANIVASLITFVSLVAFGNGVVSWFAALIGFEGVTLVSILATIFAPVAFAIGIEPSQSFYVGELIATKALINEFVAYQKLGEFKRLKMISARTEAIATYALCSFSNPGSIASLVATMSTLCPQQKQNATNLAFRAYIGGLVTCFITASIAGLLIPFDGSFAMTQKSLVNSTNVSKLNSTFYS